MEQYLKLYRTNADYEAATDKPQVSHIVEDVDVKMKGDDPYNGHEYVDLGLPSGTKWAKMNVGASSETDYGNYYQYGKGASRYQITSGQSNYNGTESPLALSADTAAQVMGGKWHMPTNNQFQELTARTTFEWVTINGVNGGKFTATNGNYVFFPAGGNWWERTQESVGINGSYPSSTNTSNVNTIYFLYLYSTSKSIATGPRKYGCTVRGVVG